MTQQKTELGGAWWAKSLDDVDREVARLALACNARILDPGVIERVLDNDASVCGTGNPVAFRKLRDVLMMHYRIRERAAGALGQAGTAQIVSDIVERLKKQFGDRLGGEHSPGG